MATAQTLRIAIAQVNPTVGDIEGNTALVREWIGRAEEAEAQLVLFPELVVTGYPPEDLLLKRHFLDASARAVVEIAKGVRGPVVLVGYAEVDPETSNALAVIADGAVQGSYRKNLLPNYGVFDERRYFEPGSGPALVEVAGVLIGLTVCEDIWLPGPPASIEALAGASLIVNPSASPYHAGKGLARERMVAERAEETGAAVALCNMVGGQDELVFDGHSVIVDAGGETVARAAQFEEELLVCDLELGVKPAADSRSEPPPPADLGGEPTAPAELGSASLRAPVIAAAAPAVPSGPVRKRLVASLQPDAEVYAALVLGLRDYARKNRFERAVLALSGGIDSALVALLARDALGADRITCVVMPSPNSSAETQADARRIARNLGAQLIDVPIDAAMAVYADLLADPFDRGAEGTASGRPTRAGQTAPDHPDIAAENIQARIRGNLVMALSNRFGWLALTTGNKSELSVGYATLYGDMAGGFAVIKDVPKTLVYRLVRERNQREDRELIPQLVLDRPPTAELRPNQLDEDTLPPYDVLDRILEEYVEQDRGRDEIVAAGLPEAVVDQVIALVDGAEYKRRQAPPGVKISPKAFGRDRRLPITNRFRG
jgi:NAD+ synthase (glutamine-hydrolysing)